MAGAWEYKKPDVLVALLTRELVSTAWAIGFRNLQMGNGSYYFMTGMPFDHARNSACEKALECDFQWLMFLDDDVIPPPDAFFRLAGRDKDIISGLYIRRNDPIAPVMLRESPSGPQFVDSFTAGDLLDVDLVGAGCLLIRRKVIETMKTPWFEWLVDRKDIPPEDRCSEDFAFCRAARRAGFKIYVDTSVQCRHVGVGKSELANGGFSFTPMNLNQ